MCVYPYTLLHTSKILDFSVIYERIDLLFLDTHFLFLTLEYKMVCKVCICAHKYFFRYYEFPFNNSLIASLNSCSLSGGIFATLRFCLMCSGFLYPISGAITEGLERII